MGLSRLLLEEFGDSGPDVAKGVGDTCIMEVERELLDFFLLIGHAERKSGPYCAF